MTREQAERAARQLSSEHPDRARYQWFARETADGSWSLVKVQLPGGRRAECLKPGVQAKPGPAEPDDPRPSSWRDLGGPNVGPG